MNGTEGSNSERSPADRLRALLEAAETLWAEYAERGPGNMEPDGCEPVVKAAADIASLPEAVVSEAVSDAAATLADLAHRCTRYIQGLCFITGEAGLIPRRDQHEAFEAALATLRAALEDAGTAPTP